MQKQSVVKMQKLKLHCLRQGNKSFTAPESRAGKKIKTQKKN